MMHIRQIVKVTAGKLLSGSSDIDIGLANISTDSRSVVAGDLFLALKGPNFDGNDFIKEAFGKGAIGAIISGPWTPGPVVCSRRGRPAHYPDRIIIRVDDTMKALQDIAAYHRGKFKIPVIAVTGSNGKTTAKEMIAAVLSKKFNVLKNTGTENNHIGVSQTLLRLKPGHDICVLELGTNHKGEIKSLANIARPTVAVITNIGPSHLEFLQDLKGVYEEKKDILGFLDKNRGLAVVNGDDGYLSKINDSRTDILRYGFKRTNDFCAEALKPKKDKLLFVVNKRKVYELNLCGTHNIYNALAGIVLADRFGVSYKDTRNALSSFMPERMRLVVSKIRGFDVINDSYNSNPLSMASALEVLKYYPAKSKWVVSADMLELGGQSERFHRLAGEEIAKNKVKGLLTFGEFSKYTSFRAAESGLSRYRVWHCSSHDEIAGILKKVVGPGDAVLLKGSRAMKMEEVLKKLE